MNITAKMLQLLTSAYIKRDERNVRKGLPLETNIGRFFSVISWGLGLIQDNAEHVRLWADLDTAAGAVLDRYGANYGVARGGADDIFYRILIKTKLLAQISGGDIDTVISAISTLYGIDPEEVDLTEVFPAKVQVVLSEDDLPAGYEDIREAVGSLIKRLLGAGIGLDMVYVDEDETAGVIYLGGATVSEFGRIRVAQHIKEMIQEIPGAVGIGGRPVAEFTRIRLHSEIE